MRRLPLVLTAAAVLLSPGLVGCGDSGSEVAENDLSPAAALRQAAAQSDGRSFAFTMEGTQDGHTLQGTGEYSGGEKPAMHVTMTSTDAEFPGGFETIVIGRTFWVKSSGSALSPLLADGKWLKTSEDDNAGEPEEEVGTDDLDIRVVLQGLLAAADVREVGIEDIDGVSTRHLAGVVTAAAVAANTEMDPKIRKGLAEDLRASEGDKADIEVWLDRDLQIRRYTEKGNDEDGDYTMSMTFSRFGEQFDIAAPPKGQVQDTKNFGKLLEQRMKDAAKKVRAKYKTEAEFKKACQAAGQRLQQSMSDEDTPKVPSKADQELLTACGPSMF